MAKRKKKAEAAAVDGVTAVGPPDKTAVRDRNKGLRKVRVADIEDAPWNFRTHSNEQAVTLDTLLDKIGWYGHPDVYETPDGKLRLVDGHLRKSRLIAKYGAEATIEVNLTDFTEEEAKEALLTKDPLSAMAGVDSVKLDTLMQGSSLLDDAEMAALKEALNGLIPAGFDEVTFVPDQEVIDKKQESMDGQFTRAFQEHAQQAVSVVCPKCMEEFSVFVTKADVIGLTSV